MKNFKRVVNILLILCICIISIGVNEAQAVDMYKYYKYHKSDKLYNIDKKYQGMEMSYKKNYYNYQVVEISKNKITLKAQTKWVDSADPIFESKEKTYKLSSKCKFYYTNVTFPGKQVGNNYIRYYKKISKSVVKQSLSTGNEWDRYFGKVFVKNGKIIAMACDGGD